MLLQINGDEQQINETLKGVLAIASMCATKGKSAEWRLDKNERMFRYVFDVDNENYMYYASVVEKDVNCIRLCFHFTKGTFAIGYDKKITMMLNAVFPQSTHVKLSIFEENDLEKGILPEWMPNIGEVKQSDPSVFRRIL